MEQLANPSVRRRWGDRLLVVAHDPLPEKQKMRPRHYAIFALCVVGFIGLLYGMAQIPTMGLVDPPTHQRELQVRGSG